MDARTPPRAQDPPGELTPADRRQRAILRLLVVLVGLSVAGALYAASDIMIPVVAAGLLGAVFAPVQLRLMRARLPPALGATLIAGALGALVVLAAAALAAPASNWIDRVPEIAFEVKQKLRGSFGLLDDVRRASKEVEEVAKAAGGQEQEATPVVVREEGGLLQDVLQSMRDAGLQLVVVVVVLWFLLAAGPPLLQHLNEEEGHRRERRRISVAIARITRDISAYMLTITVINTGLGAAVGLALWATELPNPLLWGAMAAVLNFMPYIGGVIGVGIVFVVGMITFETLLQAAVPAICYALINGLEGQWLTPMIVGRRLTLNPLAVFLFLLFWGWLWGMPGALMAVPIMVTARVICIHALPDGAALRMIRGKPQS